MCMIFKEILALTKIKAPLEKLVGPIAKHLETLMVPASLIC